MGNHPKGSLFGTCGIVLAGTYCLKQLSRPCPKQYLQFQFHLGGCRLLIGWVYFGVSISGLNIFMCLQWNAIDTIQLVLSFLKGDPKRRPRRPLHGLSALRLRGELRAPGALLRHGPAEPAGGQLGAGELPGPSSP